MVKCPRCGFEQPTDRFCAKCGIAMDRYVAKKPPLSARYGTPLFIFGVIGVFVVGLVAYLLYKSKTLDQVETAAEVAAPMTPPLNLAENTTPGPPPAQNPAARASPETTPLLDIKPSRLRALGARAAGGTLEGGRPPEALDGAMTQDNQTVRIEFDLVNRDVLDRLTREGEGQLEIGRYGLSVVPHFKANYRGVHGDANFKALATETRGLTLAQPSLVFRGGKEPKSNETIGFFIDITPTRVSDRGTEYKVSIKRSLPELSLGGELRITSQNYDETSTLPPGAALVFSGLLPRKQLVEGEDELYKANILSALLDPAFQKGDAEFLIVVTPQMNEIAN